MVEYLYFVLSGLFPVLFTETSGLFETAYEKVHYLYSVGFSSLKFMFALIIIFGFAMAARLITNYFTQNNKQIL